MKLAVSIYGADDISVQNINNTFFNSEIDNGIARDACLTERPNIILIFTEGLSQNIISDERSIMPNVAEYQKKGLAFTGYYNHTFATYRGIIGQLYSGYQNNDFDSNELISIQDILSSQGYHTMFLNSEPRNDDFSNYLMRFGFDELLGEKEWVHNGEGNAIADEDMYEMLLYWGEKYKKENTTPFFLATYTVGTHATFDSSDKKFGDGSSRELNRFFNADYHFGEFMEKFEQSSLADNTIIVFTSDHATYQDDDFDYAFPNYKRTSTMVDQIPFFIWYKGIESVTIDVNGRNSLCLAPTILDYLDISAPNYFMGTSLFKQDESDKIETVFYCLGTAYNTAGKKIQELDFGNRSEIQKRLTEYFSISNQKFRQEEVYLTAEYDDEGLLEVTVYNVKDVDNIWLPTWSVEGGQDDLVWYKAEKELDGTWKCKISINSQETYAVHVYGGKDEPETFLYAYYV